MNFCGVILRATVFLFLSAGSALIAGPTTQPQTQSSLSPQQQNKQAFAELRKAIDERYSYRDYRKTDWNTLYKVYAPRIERAKTPQEFAERATDMLARNKDPHLRLEFDKKRYSTYSPKINRNYSIETLSKVVPNWQKKNNRVYTGRYPDGIGYILITSWSGGHKEEVDAVFKALKELKDTNGLILDVRPNGGGSEFLAGKVAGCFIDKPKIYSKHVNRIPGPEMKFSEFFEKTVNPSKDQPQYKGNVVVLMGQNCMSSSDSFLLMMKQAPNCKLIGERSFGSSGNPKTFELCNGVKMLVPSWKNCLLDGTCFEGKGISPDILVKADAASFKKRDPVLERALNFLRSQKNKP